MRLEDCPCEEVWWEIPGGLSDDGCVEGQVRCGYLFMVSMECVVHWISYTQLQQECKNWRRGRYAIDNY